MNLKNAQTYIAQSLSDIYDKREAKNITSILLEHLTGLTKVQRLVEENKILTPDQKNNVENYIQQLLQHKPIQHLLGYAWFYQNKFCVNENVLIPRPETEELIDLVIKKNSNNANLSIIDIGTGSGCIAISLKLKLQQAKVTAIDVSNKALEVAIKNANLLQADVTYLPLDFLNENDWNKLATYDIIISNPPYVSFEEKKEMQKNVLDYEPHLALFTPENDVLIFYRAIADFAITHLKPAGKIYVEINETLSKETAEIFTSKGFQTETIKDLQEKTRIITATKSIH